MQLSANLQEFVAKSRVSASKLQANHQPCTIACYPASAHNARDVPRDMWTLSWYIFGELELRNLSGNRWRWSCFLQFNTLTNALARCPHCRKVSSVGIDFARNRSNVYLAFGFLFLAVGIAVTWTTYAYAVVSWLELWTLVWLLCNFLYLLAFRITLGYSWLTLACSSLPHCCLQELSTTDEWKLVLSRDRFKRTLKIKAEPERAFP